MVKKGHSKKKTKHTKTKHKKNKKPKSLLERVKHWLEKRGQGLPMTTIVIIIIVIIVLAVVILFFFGQFSAGKTTVGAQQEVSVSATQTAKCNAWAAGILPTQPCDGTIDKPCSKEAICNYMERVKITSSPSNCYCSDCASGTGQLVVATDC